ncbi:TIGR01244 family sulfur transferase [Sphingosinicella sp.]|uniref:TIGR01244 family sulfur transferase n=1 Tax=Sphingosinicella sp. TaxID=1917971 RepID=UPI0040378A1B
MFRRLDTRTFVAGQIGAGDIAEARALGVTMIVNNRPDGEEPGQPTSTEIAGAARAAGLDYRHIPVAGGFSLDQVEAMAAAMEEAEGKVLAFCRSGTRSTCLWALARKTRGGDGAEIMQEAAEAGYDLSPLQDFLMR